MSRLAGAGFNRKFITTAILPEWWDKSCALDPAILPDFEFRVARFLDTPLAVVQDDSAPLKAPAYEDAQLRKVFNIEHDRLAPAIHTAMEVAAAVVRNLRPGALPDLPADDALQWRESLQQDSTDPIYLQNVLTDMWRRGIPVLPLEKFPTPSFQGLACIVGGRPVVVLGHKHDQPARVAFITAHEAGHIAAGDCSPEGPVVDADMNVPDDNSIEWRADRYAQRLLLGESEIAELADEAPPASASLRQWALQMEQERGIEASAAINAWSVRTRDFPAANAAVKALGRAKGARDQLSVLLDSHIDFESASDTDRALLRCLYGEPRSTASAA